MRERMEFLMALESELYTMSELCERFGVSRKTGYKWVHRLAEAGVEGMADRSRRPQSSPGQAAKEIEGLFVALRQRHADWGPKKLIRILGERHAGSCLPARSHGTVERGDYRSLRAAQPLRRRVQ